MTQLLTSQEKDLVKSWLTVSESEQALLIDYVKWAFPLEESTWLSQLLLTSSIQDLEMSCGLKPGSSLMARMSQCGETTEPETET